MTKSKNIGRGGSRPGSGKPKGKPTKSISVKVPIDRAEDILVKVKKLVEKELSSHPDSE